MIRFFDIFFALLGIIILSPLLLILGILIKLGSKGPVLYKQERIGKHRIPFKLLKFRSMKTDSDKDGLLTVGGKDKRITSIGYILRKYKLDELPQLFNVVKGDMSIVGPRPEVRKYVNYYTKEQLNILNVKPGISDLSSIEFYNENEILENAANPENYYIKHIMPKKIEMNQHFANAPTIKLYFSIIYKTLQKIIKH